MCVLARCLNTSCGDVLGLGILSDACADISTIPVANASHCLPSVHYIYALHACSRSIYIFSLFSLFFLFSSFLSSIPSFSHLPTVSRTDSHFHHVHQPAIYHGDHFEMTFPIFISSLFSLLSSSLLLSFFLSSLLSFFLLSLTSSLSLSFFLAAAESPSFFSLYCLIIVPLRQ
jgi:hypothetical protein